MIDPLTILFLWCLCWMSDQEFLAWQFICGIVAKDYSCQRMGSLHMGYWFIDVCTADMKGEVPTALFPWYGVSRKIRFCKPCHVEFTFWNIQMVFFFIFFRFSTLRWVFYLKWFITGNKDLIINTMFADDLVMIEVGVSATMVFIW